MEKHDDKYLLWHLTLNSPLLAKEAKWLVAATTVALCFLAFLLVKYMYKSTELRTPLNKMMMTQRETTTLTTFGSGAVTISSGSVQRSINYYRGKVVNGMYSRNVKSESGVTI